MNLDASTELPDDIDTLKTICIERDKRINHLEEMVRFLKLKQFGSSSERHASPEQNSFFDEAEELEHEAEQTEIEETGTDEVSTSPSQENALRKKGRCVFPDSFPRKKVYHQLSPQDSHCQCGGELTAIDEVLSEQLSVIPAQVYVIQHCRKKYTCSNCRDKAPVTAPLAPQPLPKSNASPELMAHIAVSKFLDGLPFYRQEQMWKREDVSLPRGTQANWMIGGGKLVQPLINLFADHQQEGNVHYIDETPVQVLKEPDKPPTGKKYFWIIVGGAPDKLVYRYHYDPSRGSDVARDLLLGSCGTVMSDDFSVYGKVCAELQLTHIACNDHARRKFKEALDVIPKNKKKKNGKVSKAEMAINFYKKIYAIEKRIKGLSETEKQLIRESDSVPLWDAFIAWMEKIINHVTPKSKLGKALHYTYKLRNKLRFYCHDGALPISNQIAENGIRPFAIARKNFLFYDSPRGATSSANLYSLIITSKHHGINPFHYLAFVFKHLPSATSVEDIEKLLPWNIDQTALAEYSQTIHEDVC